MSTDFDALDPARLRRKRGEKWGLYDDDVICVWVADMDFHVAEPIADYVRETAELGDLGYPINPRTQDLPSVFAERMAQVFDWTIDARRVEVLTDVVQGLYVGLSVYSEPGDGVLIQTPIYPPFLASLGDLDRRGDLCELVAGPSGYELDFDALRARSENTRVLMLCNPHNPTGRVFTREELEQLGALAVERDWIILSDEIHAELVYEPGRHVPIASLGAEIAERTVTITSATKAFNIAGLRCAVAHFGSRELQARFNSIPRHIRGGVGMLGLHATAIAWTECDAWLAACRDYLDANRRFIADFIGEHLPEVRYHLPEATYLAWLDVRALELDDPYRFFLDKARVAFTNGARFGPGGEGFVRLNFATSRRIVHEALERAAKALRDR